MKSVLPADPIGKVILSAYIAVPLALSPQFSYDPVNIIKMLITSTIALTVVFLTLSQKLQLNLKQYQIVNYSFLIFLFWSICVFIFHKNHLTQQFYGAFGRNTGLLTYLSLSVLFLFAAHKSEALQPIRILYSTILVGSLSIAYGLLQVFGSDPLKWISSYSPVVGFLGNPNFQSSLVAITAITASAIMFSSQPVGAKFLAFIYVLTSIFIVYKTNSQQGYLVFMFGFLVVLYVRIKTNQKWHKLHLPFIVLTFLSGVYVVLDILNLGIGKSILYKPSVSARGDFWRAGIEMMRDNPIFGVGFDAYGENYRAARDSYAASRFDANIGSNSAHNVFLDVGSYGGFPLFSIYVLIQVLTLLSIVRIIKRMKAFNFALVGIIGAWIGYLSQSIISISQIGLAIWGWILSGFIIGTDINQSIKEFPNKEEKIQQNRGKVSHAPKIRRETDLLAYAFGIVIGLILSMPSFLADANFRGAVESRKVEQIVNAANRWPQDSVRYDAAYFLLKKEFPVQAKEVARSATEKIPNGYPGWKNLYYSANATDLEKQIAKKKLMELDPLTNFDSEISN